MIEMDCSETSDAVKAFPSATFPRLWEEPNW